MMTLTDALRIQRKAQRKALIMFFGSLALLTAVCTCLFFVDGRIFYVSVGISVLLMFFFTKRSYIYEFFLPKQYSGEVVYFLVRTEMVKKSYANGAGATYDAYYTKRADITVVDDKGKTRYKTFIYSEAYDAVKVGDKATVFRFVDKPIIEFKNK